MFPGTGKGNDKMELGRILSRETREEVREPGMMQSNPRQLRLLTLIRLRWFAIAGQLAAVLSVRSIFGFEFPFAPALIVISASVLLNIVLGLLFPSTKRLTDREASLYLSFDILQLAALLYLTGGIENPFSILFIAPVTISAATLSSRSTIILSILSFVCVSVLAVYHLPFPWEGELPLPPIYIFGLWSALLLGIGFTAFYANRVAVEATRMSDALAATQMVLAREQRLSDLGSLAAAAAHELGTPLATIQVIANELIHDEPRDGPHYEDLELIKSQAARCRDILQTLSDRKDDTDDIYDRQKLRVVIEEAIGPFKESGKELILNVRDSEAEEPEILRRPEIIFGLGNIVENAVDFADSAIAVEAFCTPDQVAIHVIDNGPGIPPEILTHLGEPYLTSRGDRKRFESLERQEGASVPGGMGLGFFIAKTLLERTGAKIEVSNHSGVVLHNGDRLGGGAAVEIRWSRAAIEAP